jgi:hypothetical protein
VGVLALLHHHLAHQRVGQVLDLVEGDDGVPEAHGVAHGDRDGHGVGAHLGDGLGVVAPRQPRSGGEGEEGEDSQGVPHGRHS